MIRDRAGSEGTDRSAADRREQIRPVLAYVEDHRRESITLDDVAGVVHVSPSRVRHVFKDVTGVGFKEYVTNVRLAEAKRLLLGTELSIAEIARTVSYTNLHQFYRVFRRSCAMSPREYRRYYSRTAPDPPNTKASGEDGRGVTADQGPDDDRAL
jgi:YesN/AraC family two-component response regulator